MKKYVLILLLLVSSMVYSQSIIMAKYDSVYCFSGTTVDSSRVESSFFFHQKGFIVHSDIRVLSFITINSQFDKDDYRIFEDTGHTLYDSTLNQDGVIYHNEKYKTQVVIYFDKEKKYMKLYKKDKSFLIFSGIKD